VPDAESGIILALARTNDPEKQLVAKSPPAVGIRKIDQGMEDDGIKVAELTVEQAVLPV
jgi:hypothetical protein